jgi:Circularly permutated YpsA SLOG family
MLLVHRAGLLGIGSIGGLMSSVKKVVSGGQTGVDQAGLRAAQTCGLECGGWCSPGQLCESGRIPSIFPLQETPEERSADAPDIPRSQRTEWNVRDSDATLILWPKLRVERDQGTEWTIRCAGRYGRSLVVCDPDDPTAPAMITQWLRENSVHTLNVAGPSESVCPGIGAQSYSILLRVFSKGGDDSSEATSASSTDKG